MDITAITGFLRYLISPEDTILTRPGDFGRGLAPFMKTVFWIVVAMGCGMALAQLH